MFSVTNLGEVVSLLSAVLARQLLVVGIARSEALLRPVRRVARAAEEDATLPRPHAGSKPILFGLGIHPFDREEGLGRLAAVATEAARQAAALPHDMHDLVRLRAADGPNGPTAVR